MAKCKALTGSAVKGLTKKRNIRTTTGSFWAHAESVPSSWLSEWLADYCLFVFLARDAFVGTNRRAILPWCSSVRLSLWDRRAL